MTEGIVLNCVDSNGKPLRVGDKIAYVVKGKGSNYPVIKFATIKGFNYTGYTNRIIAAGDGILITRDVYLSAGVVDTGGKKKVKIFFNVLVYDWN